MERVLRYIIILFAAINLVACDYFGYFDFEIVNNTNDSLAVVYTEQIQPYSSELYTPDHEDDNKTQYYKIVLTEHHNALTDTKIPPKGKLLLTYEAGMVYRGFPDKLEDPMDYGIVPLWERIGYMTQRGDTLDPKVFSQNRWKGSGSTYTLIIEK